MIKLITLIFIFTLAYSPLAISAECKGRKKSKCKTSNSCVWVSGYKKKKSVKVSGYCRSKGKKKAKRKTRKK